MGTLLSLYFGVPFSHPNTLLPSLLLMPGFVCVGDVIKVRCHRNLLAHTPMNVHEPLITPVIACMAPSGGACHARDKSYPFREAYISRFVERQP
jgi:hypothetical protein